MSMAVFNRSCVGTLALMLAMSVASAGDGSGRQTGKKATQRSALAAPLNAPIATAPRPAQFFTINQVLAKRAAERNSGSDLKFASVPSTMSDAVVPGYRRLPSDEPFGLFAFRAPEGLLWTKWRGIEQQLRYESDLLALCRTNTETCSREAKQYLGFVNAAQAYQGRTRIELINRAVNSAIRYTSDLAQHGVADRWTAPLATFASGRGDCEDYAIAKYVLLRDAGVPTDDLRLLLVRDRAVQQDHAVLAVRDAGRWLILDNRNLALAEPTSLPQFMPLFSLDDQGVKLVAAPYAEKLRVKDLSRETLPTPAAAQAQAPSSSALPSATPYLL